MGDYSDFVANNSDRQAIIEGRIPFTRPSAIYGNLGKEALKEYGDGKEFKSIIDSLWDCELTREDVFRIFREEKNRYKGFIAAMLWGGLGSNALSRNNLRTAFSCPKSDIEKKLEDVFKKLKENKIEEAFESMLQKPNKIKGIGVSFFTKLLYFLWPKENKQDIKPLIYDKWGWHIHAALLIDEKGMDEVMNYFVISSSLSHKDGYGLIPQIVLRDGKNVSRAYMNYIKLLASKSQGDPGRLEEFLFGQSRKFNRQESNPRVFLIKCLSQQIDSWIKKTTFDYSFANEDNDSPADTNENDRNCIPDRKHSPEDIFTMRVNGEVIYVYTARDKKKKFCEVWNPKHHTYPNEKGFLEIGFMRKGGEMRPYLIRNITEMDEAGVKRLLASCKRLLSP